MSHQALRRPARSCIHVLPALSCSLLIGTGPISVPLTTVDVNNIPEAVWNLLQRDRCPKSMVSELHVLFEMCQFQTTQFLLNCLTVQGARRTSGSSTEICSVLQPMHTVCNTQWVLGSRKAWTWLAGLPYQPPPSYVCFHCFLAGNTELWSWNWGTPSDDCCCKLLGSKQICLPHEQKKCSMRASMHRPITISQDKSVMSCGEHVTHPRRSQVTVFKLGLKLSFPVTSWYLVLCEKLQSFPRGTSRQANARFCVHVHMYQSITLYPEFKPLIYLACGELIKCLNGAQLLSATNV